MNNPEQHEIDDELLSAYLDDELSAEEHTFVENRLAADPAARQTLEQLRSVSQSVRDLPSEGIGRDLREAILQRAAAARVARPESAKGVASPSPQSPAPSPQLPTVTIGRTTRGWVYASAAIAAAVLIMVLQPADERNAELPNVAQRDKAHTESSTETNRKLPESRSASRAADSQPTPAPDMSAWAAPSLPAAAPQDAAVEGRAGNAPIASAEPATSTDMPAADLFAFQAPGEATEEKAASAPAAELPADKPRNAGTQPVVVRVLARRAAVESNAFEDLLRKYGVDFEPTAHHVDAKDDVAESEPAPADSDRFAALADAPNKEESEKLLQELSPRPAATEPAVPKSDPIEFVLVEAPPSTIFSCMNALNNDAENYLGISVDEASPNDKPRDAVATAEEKQAAKFEKFNRGVVPPLSGTLDGVADVDAGLAEDIVKRRAQQQYFRARGGVGGRQELESLALGVERASDRGRALRLQARVGGEAENVEASSNVATYGAQPGAGAKSKQQSIIDQLALPAAPNGQRMQVLFVIRPTDEPAPSLKAKNQAE